MGKKATALVTAALQTAPAIVVDKPKYQLTPEERTAGNTFLERLKAAPKLPRLRKKGEGRGFEFDHDDQGTAAILIMTALGLTRSAECNNLVQQIVEATMTGGALDISAANGMLAMVVGMEPRNSTEAMLAVQMGAIHFATLRQASRLNRADQTPAIDGAANAVNKLARTFTMQMEALKKMRSTGEQKVVVEHKHYHLAPGAQAVFGDVAAHAGGGVGNEKDGLPHERMRIPAGAAVHGAIEANGMQVQSPLGDGLECVPVSRGEGRAEGGAG